MNSKHILPHCHVTHTVDVICFIGFDNREKNYCIINDDKTEIYPNGHFFPITTSKQYTSYLNSLIIA